MSLPVIETPRYQLTLPITGKELSYRPFLVGEQKALLIAQESDESVNLSKEALRLVQKCIDDDIDVNDLPMADVEVLFLNIRIKSAGETADIQIECSECNEYNGIKVDLTQYIVIKPEIIPDNNLKLTDSISIVLKYPNIKELTSIESSKEEYDIMFDIINFTIDKIINGDEVLTRDDFSNEELDKFIEGMSVDTLDVINKFMNSQPSLELTTDFDCDKCGKFNVNTMAGLESFFV